MIVYVLVIELSVKTLTSQMVSWLCNRRNKDNLKVVRLAKKWAERRITI